MNSIAKVLPCVLALLASSSARSTNSRPWEYEEEILLESPKVTPWGDWGRLQKCRPGFLVTGFQVKVEAKAENNDNTALNGVRFACGVPYRDEYKEMELITSSYGRWGTIGEKMFCNGYAVGLQLKSQKPQGRKDDVAGINIKLVCDDGAVYEGYDEKDNFYPDSEYTATLTCPEKTALCGLQTQVESPRWFGDDTSLNNVRIKCCKIPNLYLTTTPEPIESTTDAPETEAPETETPVPEIPETETPVPEIPETESPVPEIPETESPVPEIPETETPVPEIPETETPVPEIPETETPVPEIPETESPVPEIPETETPEYPKQKPLSLKYPKQKALSLKYPKQKALSLKYPKQKALSLKYSLNPAQCLKKVLVCPLYTRTIPNKPG